MGAWITYEHALDVQRMGSDLNVLFDLNAEVTVERGTSSMTVLIEGTDDVSKERFCAASFTVAEYPGNCGIVISTGAYVHRKLRDRGLGQYLHNLRIRLAEDTGYTLMQCTVTADNQRQLHILRKNGWHRLYTFQNQRTGNICEIWQLELM